uniref:Putative secreted protein n=1 Tax=Amblyomma parvum TaxID=251391 RepID=A0A023G216_AMBPA
MASLLFFFLIFPTIENSLSVTNKHAITSTLSNLLVHFLSFILKFVSVCYATAIAVFAICLWVLVFP